jgi:hypothetical protein
MSTGRATVKASRLPLPHVLVLASHLQAAQDSRVISSELVQLQRLQVARLVCNTRLQGLPNVQINATVKMLKFWQHCICALLAAHGDKKGM